MEQHTLMTLESLATKAGVPAALGHTLAFQHTPGTAVHFGCGAVDRVGELARSVGGRRVLVVTDPGIEDAGHLGKIAGPLERAGLQHVLFDAVVQNPTTVTVDACVAVARKHSIDTIIGLGGGSSMDTAKGCNFLLTNGGRMADYWGVGKATKAMLPLIVIPTTAGTGSECQSFALISDATSHVKMACGDKKAAARHAILDPLLTLTMPAKVTAVTGIDAIAHAVESLVSTKRNAVSADYSVAAWRMLSSAFERVMADGTDLEARALMLAGSALAGTAIENSMLGAAHAAANPLTATFDTPHGVAVGLMLPHVVRLNHANAEASAAYAALQPGCDPAARLTDFLTAAGLPRSLAEAGIPTPDFQTLATQADAQWTARFNPVTVDAAAFEALYRAAA